MPVLLSLELDLCDTLYLVKREREAWTEEARSAFLYRLLAQREGDPARKKLFSSLAQAAEKQAGHWESVVLQKGGRLTTAFRPDLRTRLVASLIARLGPEAIKPILAAMKVRGLSVYSSNRMPTHEKPVQTGPEKEHRASLAGGNLRAAVFGANDGLVSNASLIMGVAGASSEGSILLLSGIAGMLAGAFSMAAGEFVSVKSQRELFEYQIALEEDELREYPEEEAMELALIYEAKGLSPADSKRLADGLIADPNVALDTLAREELGLNPDELGSPIKAAAFSFVCFSSGAIIPLLPFLLRLPEPRLPLSMVFTGLALFGIGGTLSLFTGRSALWGGFRLLFIGGLAAAATFGIGKLLGVSLS